jgi:hypothetical protein
MQTERITVLYDPAIRKTHIGLYLIHYPPAGFRKSIGCHPFAGTVFFIQVFDIGICKRRIPGMFRKRLAVGG